MSVHIEPKTEIAKVVLMPGDPLRAKWIAETFLKKVKLVNQVRNMFGFTGYYKNKKISVFGGGMGIPSIGIYSHELFSMYGVKYIIRVGSAGAIDKKINLGDIAIATEAFSKSNYANEIGIKPNKCVFKPSEYLLNMTIKCAKKSKIKYLTAKVYSADAFYSKYSVAEIKKITNNAKLIEMEAFGLYANAIRNKKHALTILTCSDNLVTKKEMSAYARQTSFKNMIKLALETAICLK